MDPPGLACRTETSDEATGDPAYPTGRLGQNSHRPGLRYVASRRSARSTEARPIPADLSSLRLATILRFVILGIRVGREFLIHLSAQSLSTPINRLQRLLKRDFEGRQFRIDVVVSLLTHP